MAALTCTAILVDDVGWTGVSSEGVILVWRGYAEGPARVSVSAHLERRAEHFRAKYLAFIHDLGEREFRGRKLRDHFLRSDGLSLWWVHRVAEKSPFKSARIFDCLRLLALEDLLVQRGVTQIDVRVPDVDVQSAVLDLCRGLGIECRVAPTPATPVSWSIRTVYERLPHAIQGALSFRHLLARWRFRTLARPAWFGGPAAVTAASYFYHLDGQAAGEGRFLSHQWEDLPARWASAGGHFNWVHHYLPDGVRDIAEAGDLAAAFNAESHVEGRHAFLESFLSVRALSAIVAIWVRLVVLEHRLRGVSSLFQPEDSAASFWPLLRDDWRASMQGTAAVTHAAWVVLLDVAASALPPQRRGLFLYEGQAWECALAHAWRKHGHGELVGVPHSSMPFWYLNIYDDPRCYAPGGCGKPLPDRLAVNGPLAWRGLRAAEYPESRLVPVEALRYGYLERWRERPPRGCSNEVDPLTILMLGDFTREQTLRMLDVLAAARGQIDRPTKVAVRLHPACQLSARERSVIDADWTSGLISDALSAADVAFASNTTSACLDAVLAGVPVLTFLDDAGLNQNPLRSEAGVVFVSTPEQLAKAVESLERLPKPALALDDVFWLDEQLPRWMALLREGSRADD